MSDVLKYKISPTVFGACSCFFLLCAWGLSQILRQLDAKQVAANVDPLFVRRVEVVNYLLVFVSLCICVHFIRGTAQLFEKHVWEIPCLLVLWCVPVFNLAVTLLSLVMPDSVVFTNHFFSALLVIFSMPVFFCVYFGYIFHVLGSLREKRYMRVFFMLTFAVGAVYLLLRFCDNVLFPLCTRQFAAGLPHSLLQLAAFSSKLSAVVYLLAILGFCLFGRYLYEGATKQHLV